MRKKYTHTHNHKYYTTKNIAKPRVSTHTHTHRQICECIFYVCCVLLNDDADNIYRERLIDTVDTLNTQSIYLFIIFWKYKKDYTIRLFRSICAIHKSSSSLIFFFNLNKLIFFSFNTQILYTFIDMKKKKNFYSWFLILIYSSE